MELMKLDCSACKSDKTMEPARVAKFSGAMRVFGYIITIPAVLGILAAITLSFVAWYSTHRQLTPPEVKEGLAFYNSITYGVSLIVAFVSLAGGLAGWLLLMKRKVYKCIKCGFILDRA